MMNWKTIPQYRSNSSLVISHLSRSLINGNLVLFLGAGASADLGLPMWSTLVERCLIKTGIDPSKEDLKTSAGLARAADKVRRLFKKDKLKYNSLIRDCLYEGLTGSSVSPLLYAIGALLSGSRRGNVSNVITLNFDDVLENYLAVHGYLSTTITKYPTLLGTPDVTIFHPHGYLPRDSSVDLTNANPVLDSLSFDGMMAPNDPSGWRSYLTDVIQTKVILGVGLGLNDPNLMQCFAGMADIVGPERPSAFWLTSGNADQKLETAAYLEDRNIVSLWCKDIKKDTPDFLLKICQGARLVL